MNSQEVLNALFDLKRQEAVLAYLNPATKPFVDVAYVYALSNSIYPFFHEDVCPFETCYETRREFVDKVIKHADEHFLSKKYLTFYNYEDEFGSEERIRLADIFRYTFLCGGKFNDEFYERLVSYSPSQVHNINNRSLEDWELLSPLPLFN